MLITEEILLLQKRAGIITEAEYKEKIKELEEAEQIDPEAAENAKQGLDAGLAALKSDLKSIKPSPKDKELKEFEPVSLTAGLIASAPGLISLAGKAVNLISSPFQKDATEGTKVGNALKKIGHDMEDAYLKVLAEGLKVAFPQTLGTMEYEENNELGKAAKKLYMGILIAAGITAGMSALDAHSVISKGIEGGLAIFKGSEAVQLAGALAKAA